eukprot:TRINITY_DN5968_c0_g1_i1.p1 TRINITY_DN5968_c0_g1~~TRINITY_DN5968_c0_g1_i1.p1  ORF type:complete len:103 (+),score=37.15 TRINITY_DN5968_c0_g1_i1:42-311(+)
MSGAVTKLAKPAMRGLYLQQIKRNVLGATVFSLATSTAWYFLINKARRDNYANFYKNYDDDAEWERIKATGVLQSVQVVEEGLAELGEE